MFYSSEYGGSSRSYAYNRKENEFIVYSDGNREDNAASAISSEEILGIAITSAAPVQSPESDAQMLGVIEIIEQDLSDAAQTTQRRATVYLLDSSSNVKEIHRRNEKGQYLYDNNYAYVQMEYDKNHRIVKRSYLTAEGNPCILPDGYASIEYSYDDKGAVLIREQYLDVLRHPAANKALGYSRKDIIVNEAENIVFERYYNAQGKPTSGKEGYHAKVQSYDDYGCLLAELYSGIDNSLVFNSQGYARVDYTYNDSRQRISTTYLDTEDRPVIHKERGYATWRGAFDPDGKQMGYSYFDADGNPTRHKETGISRCEFVYDVQRLNVVEERYFGPDDALTLRKDVGYAILRLD